MNDKLKCGAIEECLKSDGEDQIKLSGSGISGRRQIFHEEDCREKVLICGTHSERVWWKADDEGVGRDG